MSRHCMTVYWSSSSSSYGKFCSVSVHSRSHMPPHALLHANSQLFQEGRILLIIAPRGMVTFFLLLYVDMFISIKLRHFNYYCVCCWLHHSDTTTQRETHVGTLNADNSFKKSSKSKNWQTLRVFTLIVELLLDSLTVSLRKHLRPKERFNNF